MRFAAQGAAAWQAPTCILQNPWIIGGLTVSILLQSAVIFYRPLAELFYTIPMSTDTLITIGLVASLVLWLEELRKFVVRRHAS